MKGELQHMALWESKLLGLKVISTIRELIKLKIQVLGLILQLDLVLVQVFSDLKSLKLLPNK
jgi:hypothetical protein